MKIFYGYRDDYFKPNKWWEELRGDIQPAVECNSVDAAFKWIKDYLEKKNFESYYYRANLSNNNDWIEIDFGSHTQFFLIYDISEKEFGEFCNKEVE